VPKTLVSDTKDHIEREENTVALSARRGTFLPNWEWITRGWRISF